uniref:Uncharacterized protein n=1 Tax=Strigamia maritima TaxID=126957 RepID=T1JLY7_STRMM
MSQNNSLNDLILPIDADGKMSDIGQRSKPFFDFQSDRSSGLLSALKMSSEGIRKRQNEIFVLQLENSEDLKENTPSDVKDTSSKNQVSPKTIKLDDCLSLKSTQAFAQSLETLMKDSPKIKNFNSSFNLKPKPGPAESLTVEALMTDSGEEMKLLCEKWSNGLSEYESFEKLIPARVDKLLKEALAFEENLIKQKEKLKENILALTNIWKKD